MSMSYERFCQFQRESAPRVLECLQSETRAAGGDGTDMTLIATAVLAAVIFTHRKSESDGRRLAATISLLVQDNLDAFARGKNDPR